MASVEENNNDSTKVEEATSQNELSIADEPAPWFWTRWYNWWYSTPVYVDTSVSNQETPGSDQETPVSNQETPVSNQETPVSNEETPVSNEEKRVLSG
jgi:hypothetical protein